MFRTHGFYIFIPFPFIFIFLLKDKSMVPALRSRKIRNIGGGVNPGDAVRVRKA